MPSSQPLRRYETSVETLKSKRAAGEESTAEHSLAPYSCFCILHQLNGEMPFASTRQLSSWPRVLAPVFPLAQPG